jgi:hypothetical protein
MLILFGVDLNFDLPIRGRLPDFFDRRHDREPGADAILIQKEVAIDVSLYTFLQILSVHSFEKIPILQAFSDGDHRPAATALPNQLNLFNT